MKRVFKLMFTVEFDDVDPQSPIEPLAYMKERADGLAESLNDALESYDFYVSFDKIEEVL